MVICTKLLDALFLPILLCSSEVWGAYDRTDAKKGEKDPIEKIHTQFYNHFISLNKRATLVQTLDLVMKQKDYHLNLTLI